MARGMPPLNGYAALDIVTCVNEMLIKFPQMSLDCIPLRIPVFFFIFS